MSTRKLSEAAAKAPAFAGVGDCARERAQHLVTESFAMKNLLIGAVALLALGGTAAAETFSLPSDAPVVNVTYPDTWKAEETDTGLQGFSKDESVTLYVELTDTSDVNANIDAAVKFLGENGVKVDKDTLKETETEVNGMPASGVNVDGTDESGPVTVGLYFIAVAPNKVVMVTNWANLNDQNAIDDADRQDIVGVIDSIKPPAQ